MKLVHPSHILVEVLEDSKEQKTEGGIWLPDLDPIENQQLPPKQGVVVMKGEDATQVEVGDVVAFDQHEGEDYKIDDKDHRILDEGKLYVKLRPEIPRNGTKRVILNKDNVIPLNEFVLVQRRERSMSSGIIIRTDDKIYNKVCDIVSAGPGKRTKTGRIPSEFKGGETCILVQYDGVKIEPLTPLLSVVQQQLIDNTIDSAFDGDII